MRAVTRMFYRYYCKLQKVDDAGHPLYWRDRPDYRARLFARCERSLARRRDEMKTAKVVNFDVSREEREVILCIVDRALPLLREFGARLRPQERIDLEMDITAAHCNGTPLRLQELLEAKPGDFAHDVFGIRRHLDRDTGVLGGHFLPRYAQPEAR